VFTKEECTVGQQIVVSQGEDGCHRFLGPVVAADPGTKIFITTVSGAQKASAMDKKDMALSIDLKASCLPYSGIAIAYAGATLDCKGNWVNGIKVTLPANRASVALPNSSLFSYPDVGRVSLSLRFMGVVMATVNFISRPLDIRFRDVFRADNVPDYEGDASEGWLKDDRYAFAKAGEQFTMRLGALMADGKSFAPSFGKEPTDLKGALPDDQIDLDLRLDLFAVNLKASPRVPIPDKDDVVQDAFAFDQAFTSNGSGGMDAKVRWYEAGVFAATPYLIDYLGTGQVGSPPAKDSQDVIDHPEKRLAANTRVIGRFYPDHFETSAVAPLACPTAVNCPLVTSDPATTPPWPVSGAVYAQQPFSFTVKAFGLPRNGKPSLLSLFENATGQNVSTQDPRGRAIDVSVVARPDGTATPAGGPFAILPNNLLPLDSDPGLYPNLTAGATYRLGTPYSADTLAARSATGAWIGPTLIYLRAGMTETIQSFILGSSPPTLTTTNVPVNSRLPAGAAAGLRYEDGLMVLSGRLYVPNVFGSELLRLPVPLAAQYWTGTAWATSDGDSSSVVAAALAPRSCMKFFAADLKSGPCKPNPLTPVDALPLQLADGRRNLVLQAPARGTSGSVDFGVDNGAARTWLPSTVGRATFGLYRSPLIYLREVY
jgi:hypothetical protein